MKSEQFFGAIGAVLIMIGVFLPILSVPIWGSINLWQIQHSMALALLLIAALHLILCIRQIWRAMYLTKIAIVAALVYMTFHNWDRVMGPTNPLMGLVRQVVKVHWGVGILAAGVLITLAATLPKPQPQSKPAPAKETTNPAERG
jgi:hypothetical protein